jgi:hypothetical protein
VALRRLGQASPGVLLALLVAAIIAFALTGCARGPSSGGPPPRQASFQVAVQQDQAALDAGILSYNNPGSLESSRGFQLNVRVQDIGKHAVTTVSTSWTSGESGRQVFYPHDVPTGGYVGLTITRCDNLTCEPISTSARQPIFGEGSAATWEWEITARGPGAATIYLQTVIYRDDTSEPLEPAQIIQITLRVKTTAAIQRNVAAQKRHQAVQKSINFVNTTAGLITTIGGAVTVIAGAVGFLIRRKRRPARPASPGHS